MDLLTTVRKEGSRGGRGDFKWSDVQSSTHRENFLGHSLMAPVGRWQKGKDLSWYAKGDTGRREGETDAERAAKERKEEIKQVKEAEQDALARALGFEVAARNPNMEALGDKKELDRMLKEAVVDEDGQRGNSVGFENIGAGGSKQHFVEHEVIEGNAEEQDVELGKALREYKRRHRDTTEHKRNKSNSKDRNVRPHRHQGRDRESKHHRRSRSREHRRSRRESCRSRSRSRSRSQSIGRKAKHGEGRNGHPNSTRGGRQRERSRSPHRRRDDRDDRYGRDDYYRRR